MLNLEENMKNTYRACAEINLDALKHNIQEIQAVLGDTKLMCVIKTNAYGHGSIVLARELAAMGAYGFAVATVDEGMFKIVNLYDRNVKFNDVTKFHHRTSC